MLSHSIKCRIFFALTLSCGLATSVGVSAVDEPLPAGPAQAEPSLQSPTLTVEQINQRLQTVDQDASLPPEVRNSVSESYRAALADLKTAQDLTRRREEFAAEAEAAGAKAERIRGKLEELKTKQPVIDSELKLVELEQQLAQLELQLATQKQNRLTAESESQTRSQRRKEIRSHLVLLQQKLEETRRSRVPDAAAEPTPLTTARQARAETSQHVLEIEIPTLEAELAKYDAEEALGIVQLRSDLAAKQVMFTEKSLEALGVRIKAARELAAAESVRKAKLEAIEAAPSLRAFAQQNQELAESAKRVADSLATAEQDLKAATDVHERLAKQFKTTKTKVELVGLTSSVGALLRKQRSTLPDVRQRKIEVANRQTLINDAQYELFEFDDERQAIADTESCIAEMIQPPTSGRETTGRDTAVLKSAAQELLARKQEYLDALIRTSNQYFDALVELDFEDRQIITLTAEYENYIDERVLWIRSARFLSDDFAIESTDKRLLDAKAWLGLGTHLAKDARDRFPLYLLAAAVIGVLMLRRKRMRGRIKDAGEIAFKANCRSMVPTVLTLALTIVISATGPLLCLFLGWRLSVSHADDLFIKGVSRGLIGVAAIWLALESLRQVCRPLGLAENHFRWSRSVTTTVRRELRQLMGFALPIMFVTGMLSVTDSSHGRNSVERVAYIAGMLVLAVFLYRILSPGGVLRDYLATHKSEWASRLRHVWGISAASVPLTLGLLATFGYYYTAEVLFWRVFATALFGSALFVLRSMFLRMLMLRRRSLSIAQSRQRAAAAASSGSDDEGRQSVAGIVTSTPESDISTHSLQSQRLVNSALIAASVIGLWCIWVQVLPALGMLDKYELWGGSKTPTVAAAAAPAVGLVPGQEALDRSAATGDATDESTDVVTASDLALAILLAFVTFVLARNGPGLLEISVLQQLPVDQSVRYAITTLVSYAIVLAGTIATCSTIGLQWSQIQWLATALTFGLAFGLQEMFANFVAGLIILLERPIRVGDVVTVDDVTGVVSRIRIRATSITNWDRKEYVVPNKEFITGRLLNWTLSDKVNRIVIEVGLAYGSDTERAREILLKAANDHPLILDDPPSLATFEGFGDNALNLSLRTYLPTLDNRLEVIHQLHTEIDQAFRRAGIEVAFPQRDLHIRTMPAAVALGLEGDRQQTKSISEAA
ncbi:Miniconductance mechanosensitive channel MscM precursor [Stieleria neptunia]|uniref:Miniconductance mechanosensitive channel MscM n=1 Tax=Stieleria neptunia TaxID=2527979 RepID=A0A518I1X4_9BACT|nr:mechanosensitive ion channel domain-containing protein [Stieleria neptunia]QDV47078.1 Miniconductance mechanosensitive channel MscM precursor [Stieleria neptunia]